MREKKACLEFGLIPPQGENNFLDNLIVFYGSFYGQVHIKIKIDKNLQQSSDFYQLLTRNNENLSSEIFISTDTSI